MSILSRRVNAVLRKRTLVLDKGGRMHYSAAERARQSRARQLAYLSPTGKGRPTA